MVFGGHAIVFRVFANCGHMAKTMRSCHETMMLGASLTVAGTLPAHAVATDEVRAVEEATTELLSCDGLTTELSSSGPT